MRTIVAWLALACAAAADGPPRKEPAPRAKGKVYAWAATDGLEYVYHVPKAYDPEAGANLTFVLHGSNLTRHWGFANHRAGEFRTDDIVVCPDGTTPNGKGGHNFLQAQADVRRLKALHDELRAIFSIRATYLYGHSQGSFFALLYAGVHKDDVQGVVAHASGAWIGTPMAPDHHHQAVVLLHGTADPVVPYGNSVAAFRAYAEEHGYPLVRLRSIQGYNHWPHQRESGMQLAWCEGMTTADPARLVASFEHFEDLRKNVDAVAFYGVARRLAAAEDANPAARRRAQKVVQEAERLAEAHAAAVRDGAKGREGGDWPGGAWTVHAYLFLRDFRGLPACDALRTEWSDALAGHRARADEHFKRYRDARQTDPAAAVAAGVAAIREGWLDWRCHDVEFLDALDAAAKGKLDRETLAAYREVVPAFREATEDGWREFASLNRKFP